MDIAVSGFKGGVGKTTTVLHIAQFLTERFPKKSVLVVDYDSNNKSAISYAKTAQQNGKPLPFKVIADDESLELVGNYEHVVFDLPGSPEENKLLDISQGVDLIILPSGINDRLNIESVLKVARALDPKKYRVLVTMAPPRPQKDGDNLRSFFVEEGIPVFETIVRQKKEYNHATNDGRLVIKGQYENVTDEILKILEVL